MSATSSALDRRRIPASSAVEDSSIRPFRFDVPDDALADLRRRLAATRWPDRETCHGSVAGRAARDDAEARALLGDGLRLAQGARRG